MNSVTVKCPAKINLSLSVGRPRATDGYHPIASWMVAVSLFDELTLEPGEGESRFDIGWADDAPRPTPIDWPVERDLIHRAHGALSSGPIRAKLRKRIPTGAGMGGGSSDAAGMLKALMQLFQLRLGRPTLMATAAKLGSDVPFFLGETSAIVRGLGETIEPAPLAQPLYLTLILPELHCNTAAVYRKFDELRPNAKLLHITAANRMQGVLMNDLADAAFSVEPRLRELRDRCALVSGKSVHVTGSGAGLFIIQPDMVSSIQAAGRVRQKCNVVTVPVTTL